MHSINDGEEKVASGTNEEAGPLVASSTPSSL